MNYFPFQTKIQKVGFVLVFHKVKISRAHLTIYKQNQFIFFAGRGFLPQW